MTLYIFLGAAAVALTVVLSTVARKKVVAINDRFLEASCASIREAYIRVSEEFEEQQFDLSYARQLFNERAEIIILNYCEQLYSGVEYTPTEKYAFLCRQVEKLNKNFFISYGIAG